MDELSSEAFNLILAKLNADQHMAAEEYLTLRSKVEYFFTGKNLQYKRYADVALLTDRAFDRLAKKLAEDTPIEKAVISYTLGIARFIWLEYLKKPVEIDIIDIPEPSVPATESDEEENLRLACLRSCMATVPKDAEERKLILDYYRSNGAKLKEQRKSLAESLDTNTNALKVKMNRLREKLKICIEKCLEKTLRV